MDDSPEEWRSHLENLRWLRTFLAQGDERQLIEPWAFLVWGLLIWAGTAANYLLEIRFHWSIHESFLQLWLPLLIVGVVVETVAFFIHFRRVDQVWLSKPYLRTMIGLVGCWIGFSIIGIVILTPSNPVPSLLLILLALCYFWIGSITFSSLFFEAAGLLLLGTAFLATGWEGSQAFLVTGIAAGMSFIAAGLQCRGHQGRHE